MASHTKITLGVNVDHVATLRQARGTSYPDPVLAAEVAKKAGADSITVHLREDRRHIQEYDVYGIQEQVRLPLNLEMAATKEMLAFALKVSPQEVCLVPEKREELTTEGGLDVVSKADNLCDYVRALQENNIKVSLFIDSNKAQIDACHQVGANIIELHTGAYADVKDEGERAILLNEIKTMSQYASKLNLQVNAGHGLHYQNSKQIAAIEPIQCLNIGHAIIARAVITGLHEAVFTMKKMLINARLADN